MPHETRHEQKGTIKHCNLFVTRKKHARKHCNLSFTLKEYKLIYSSERWATRCNVSLRVSYELQTSYNVLLCLFAHGELPLTKRCNLFGARQKNTQWNIETCGSAPKHTFNSEFLTRVRQATTATTVLDPPRRIANKGRSNTGMSHSKVAICQYPMKLAMSKKAQ